MLAAATYTCPFCFQVLETSVDPTQGAHQRYVEDCQVCCRPAVLFVVVDPGGEVQVDAEPEAD